MEIPMSNSFMFSMDHPEALPHIEEVPSGLLPFEGLGEHPHKLVVKASKELIITALHRREFFVYLAPIKIQEINSYSLISAFFDDPDEPLIIFTPIVEGPTLADDVFRILLSERFEIFFFDQLNRERLGFTASSFMPDTTLHMISNTRAFPQITHVREVYDQCHNWFAQRSTDDDHRAIRIKLGEELFPSDAMLLDLRKTENTGPIHVSSLDRQTNPGDMQELEIFECLQRTIEDGEILIGPLRVDTGKEVADVVAWTGKSVFILQAKDIENTESSVNASVRRKISKNLKKMKAGLVQLKGAIKYAQRSNSLILRDKQTADIMEIDLSDRTIYGLVIVTELFDYEYEDYTKLAQEVGRELGVLCLPMSFSQLAEYTFELPEEDRFVGALCTVYWQGMIRGAIPKLRFNYPQNDDC
jgi:hypothetical protein